MWTFKQSNGLLSQNGSVVSTAGWAGQGTGKNNPAMQCVPKIGPLPRGLYTFTAPYDHTPANGYQHNLGPYVMNLLPDPSNDMCGRGSFRIHGAAIVNPELSSEGCVIQPRYIRTKMWESGDHQVTVIE